tara:strand:+ start:228 stop:743 length:516 start_codon:yes stop_codon:yes gene_type:complete
MKKKNKIFISISALLIFFGSFYFSLKNNIGNNDQIMVGKTLPRINLISTNGKKIDLPILGSKDMYLINIWASWCVPCRQEHPYLMQFMLEKKIKIIAINYKDDKKKAELFLTELGNPYDFVGIDNDGSKTIEIGAYGVPETYLIDKSGKIIFKHTGPIDNKSYIKITNYIK